MPLSYNEERYQTAKLRHLFVPSGYTLAAELIVAIIGLIAFNLSTLSPDLGGAGNSIDASPFSIWSRVLDKLFSPAQHVTVQRAILFMLWAIVGALIYIAIFRLLQISIRARGSLEEGALLVQNEHSLGAMHYLASLHDLFVKLVIGLLGTAALLTGALLCFAIANQELSAGLDSSFPVNLGNFAIALAGVFIAVRVIMIGISLLSPRFRVWYNA